jgi:hypothetical protein
VDPRAGLHDVEKRKLLTLPGLELRLLDLPACNPVSLYRLRHPGCQGNPVLGVVTRPPCHWGDIHTATWSSKSGVGRKADDFAL